VLATMHRGMRYGVYEASPRREHKRAQREQGRLQAVAGRVRSAACRVQTGCCKRELQCESEATGVGEYAVRNASEHEAECGGLRAW
jgi:hypothetical protein